MAGEPIHLGIKVGYTLFLLVLVPVYWVHYGPRNFLWFSDIALLTTGVTLWVESPLLASMMMLAVLLPEIAWNLDFFGRLLTGHTMLGMSAYMFDGRTPGYLRALSLFHVPLPIGLVWLVTQLGYDRRAWLYQSLLAEDGQDPASAVFALSRRLYVAENTSQVRQAAERCVAFHYTWAKQMGIAKSGPHGDLTFDELFDSSYIFGTPDECVARLGELHAMGLQEVICNMNFAGVLEHRQVLDSMQLFAANVMPQLA